MIGLKLIEGSDSEIGRGSANYLYGRIWLQLDHTDFIHKIP